MFFLLLFLFLTPASAQDERSLFVQGQKLESCLETVAVDSAMDEMDAEQALRIVRYELTNCWQYAIRAQTAAMDQVAFSRVRKQTLHQQQLEYSRLWLEQYRYRKMVTQRTWRERHQAAVTFHRPGWCKTSLSRLIDQPAQQEAVRDFVRIDQEWRQVVLEYDMELRIEARAAELVSVYGVMAGDIVETMQWLHKVEQALQNED